MDNLLDTQFLNDLIGLSSYEIIMIVVIVGLLSFSKEIGQRLANLKVYCPKKAMRLRKVKSHLFFRDLQTWRQITIKNLDYDCELKRKLFTDMLDIKLKCLYTEIVDTISKDGYFDYSLEEFRSVWVSFQPKVRLSWRESCEEEGVFGDILRRMDGIYEEKADVIQQLIKSVCRDTSKKTVFEKTITILDIHRAVYYSLLENTLQDILKDINGELVKRTYKGYLCKD